MNFPDPSIQAWHKVGDRYFIWDGDKWTQSVDISNSASGTSIDVEASEPLINLSASSTDPYNMDLDAETLSTIDEVLDPTFIGSLQIEGPTTLLSGRTQDGATDKEYTWTVTNNGNALEPKVTFGFDTPKWYGDAPELTGDGTIKIKVGSSGDLVVHFTVTDANSMDSPKVASRKIEVKTTLFNLDSDPYLVVPESIPPGTTANLAVEWTNGIPEGVEYDWVFDRETSNKAEFNEFTLASYNNPDASNGADYDFSKEFWKCTDKTRIANGEFFQLRINKNDSLNNWQIIMDPVKREGGDGIKMTINTYGEPITIRAACKFSYNYEPWQIEPGATGWREITIPFKTKYNDNDAYFVEIEHKTAPAILQIKDWHIYRTVGSSDVVMRPSGSALNASPFDVSYTDASRRTPEIFCPSHTGTVKVSVRVKFNNDSSSFNGSFRTDPGMDIDYKRYSLDDYTLDSDGVMLLQLQDRDNDPSTALNRGETNFFHPKVINDVYEPLGDITYKYSIIFRTQEMKKAQMYADEQISWEQPPVRLNPIQDRRLFGQPQWWCPNNSYVEDPHKCSIGKTKADSFTTFRTPDGTMDSYEFDDLIQLTKDKFNHVDDTTATDDFTQKMMFHTLELTSQSTWHYKSPFYWVFTNENDFDIDMLIIVLGDTPPTDRNTYGNKTGTTPKGSVMPIKIPANSDHVELQYLYPNNTTNLKNNELPGGETKFPGYYTFVIPAYDGAKVKFHGVYCRDSHHISEGGVYGERPYTLSRNQTWSADFNVCEIPEKWFDWSAVNIPNHYGAGGYLPGVKRNEANLPIGRGSDETENWIEDNIRVSSGGTVSCDVSKEHFGWTPTISYDDYTEIKFQAEIRWKNSRIDTFTSSNWYRIFHTANTKPLRLIGRGPEGFHEWDCIPSTNPNTDPQNPRQYSDILNSSLSQYNLYWKYPSMRIMEDYSSYPDQGSVDYFGLQIERYRPKRVLDENGVPAYPEDVTTSTPSAVSTPYNTIIDSPSGGEEDYNVPLAVRSPKRTSIPLRNLSS